MPVEILDSIVNKWRAAPGDDDSYIYAIALQ
jgi:hypothetical protein